MKSTLLLLPILIACGNGGTSDRSPPPFQEPALTKSIDYFEVLVGRRSNTTVSFQLPANSPYEMPSTVLGVCFPRTNEVTVNPIRWPTLGVFQQYALMAHELLHCQYSVDHIDSRPSIMNPNIASEYYLKNNWPSIAREIQVLSTTPSFSFLPNTLEAE